MCESFEELDLKKQQMNYVRRQVIIASVALLKFFYFLPFLHRIAHYFAQRYRVSCHNRLHFPKERHKNAIKYTDPGVASNHRNGDVTADGRPP